MLLVSGVYYNLYNVLQDEKGAAVNATAPLYYYPFSRRKYDMNTNKRLYLVTGAAGFPGGTVCRQLAGQGCDVGVFILRH